MERVVTANRLGFFARSRLLQSLTAVLVLTGSAITAGAPAMAQTAQISVLPAGGATLGVTIAPNGAVWMAIDANAGQATPPCATYCYNESVVRISATQGTELFSMPALHFLAPLMVGGDNNMWTYVQFNAPPGVYPGPSVHLQTGAVIQCGLVTIKADDNYTMYPTAAEVCGQNRSNPAVLQDGNFWVVGAESQTLANLHLTKISPTGGTTRIAITLPALPAAYPAIADDKKNNIWFASSAGKIARYVTTASTNGPAVGTVTEFSITGDRVIKALKRGQDGNVWFIEGSATSSTAQDDSIGVVTPEGVVSEYPLPGNRAVLSQLIQGSDGTVWFLNSIDAEAGTGPVRAGRISRDGSISETVIPEFTTLVRGLGFQDGGRAIAQWAVASDRAYFALHPATTISTWDYAHAVISSSAAKLFPLRAGAIYSTAQSTSQSFLRFFNTGTTTGPVSLTLRNASGQSLGQWTSPNISPKSEVQYSIGTIEAALGINGANTPLYTMSLETALTGNFQHVLFRPSDGTLTNLSTCDAGVNAEASILGGVHSALIGSGFPSSIVIKNTGTASQTAILGIYDARDGRNLATVTIDNTNTRTIFDPTIAAIPANGTLVLPVSYIEAQAKLTPPAGAYHYVVKLESGFTGFMQHLVDNTKLGVVTDMTTSCSFGGTTGTAATPLRLGVAFAPQASAESYLRFYNTGTAAGTVAVTFYNYLTGAGVGAWTSPTIAAGAEQQFGVGAITAAAGISTTNSYYTLSVQSSNMTGYFQDVLFRPVDGTLTNLSTCASGITAIATRLSGVHTSQISGFPSSIVVNNTGAVASAFTLGIYDARDGTKLGTYVTPSVAVGGQAVISEASIEASIGQATSGMFHYTIKAEGAFTGFLQHLVDNQQAGVITDMTTACAIITP